MKDYSQLYDDQLCFARGKPCGASHISSSYVCRLDGIAQIDENIDSNPAGSPLNAQQLAVLKDGFDAAKANGNVWKMPFKIPEAYDDNSGTPEACKELCDMRTVIKQDKKTGTITIPKGVEVSDKARALVDEWNSLERDKNGKLTVFSQGKTGTELNTNGLGVMGGPRDSVPKDALRGLVQYAALRRQDAQLMETENGMRITTYRDPFTGTPRVFTNESGKIVASQDHWNKPFSLYGIRSENDVRNTVYMPASMNSAKETKSPVRFAYTTLQENEMASKEGIKLDQTVISGFKGKRYANNPDFDFLPRGQTRASEAESFKTSNNSMLDASTRKINGTYVPKMRSNLEKGKYKGTGGADQAAKDLFNIAKQRADGNYFGKTEKAAGRSLFNEQEEKLFRGIGINKVDDAPAKKSDIIRKIKANMADSDQSPEGVIAMVLAARES